MLVQSVIPTNNKVDFKWLTPGNYYYISCYNAEDKTMLRFPIYTPNIEVDYECLELTHKSISLKAKVNTQGLEGVMHVWKLGDGETGEWSDYPDNELSVTISDLKELKDYHLLLDITWIGGHFCADPYRFKTRELQPVFSLISQGCDYIDLRCDNLTDLQDAGVEEYGVSTFLKGDDSNSIRYISTRDNQFVRIMDLKTSTPVRKADTSTGGYFTECSHTIITPFTIRNGQQHDFRQLDDIILESNLTYPQPLCYGKSKVILKGAIQQKIYAGNSQYRAYFDLRKIDGSFSYTKPLSEESDKNFPNSFENTYYASLPHNGSGDYEARIRCNYRSGSEYCATPWTKITIQESPENICPGYFITPTFEKGSYANILKTHFISSGDNWEISIRYREKGESEWKEEMKSTGTSNMYASIYTDKTALDFSKINEFGFVARCESTSVYSDILRLYPSGIYVLEKAPEVFNSIIESIDDEYHFDSTTRADYVEVFTLNGCLIANFYDISIADFFKTKTLDHGIYIVRARYSSTVTTSKFALY